jgi:hypothetical protein
MELMHTKLLSGAVLWFVLALVLVLRAPAGGQEAPQGGPMIVKSGGPVLPTVAVEHKGRLLVLTYGPTSAGGALMSNAGPRGEPPEFTIYKGQRKIASGHFEYG